MTKQIITAILFIFIHCWILKAEVTIKDILCDEKDINYKQLDLLLGRLWIESGFLPKFRKYCNAKYEVKNSKRSYHDDIGNDGVAELVIKLFPGYTTGNTISHNRKFENPKDLIDLFWFCQIYETLRTKKPEEIIDELIKKMKNDLNCFKSKIDMGIPFDSNWRKRYNGVIYPDLNIIKKRESSYNSSSNAFNMLEKIFLNLPKDMSESEIKEIIKDLDLNKYPTIWELAGEVWGIIQRKNLTDQFTKLEGDELARQKEVAKQAALFLVKNEGKYLNKENKNISISKNFDLVAQAIDDEQKHGYAKYTVKNMILAAISKVLEPKNTEKKAEPAQKMEEKAALEPKKKAEQKPKMNEKAAPKTKTLKEFYDDYDVCRNSLPETLIKDIVISKDFKENDFKKAVQIIREDFSASSDWVTYSDPCENGKTNWIKVNSKDALEEERSIFEDCHETAIRHTFNSVLGSEKIKIENIKNTIDAISARVDVKNKTLAGSTSESGGGVPESLSISPKNRLTEMAEFYREVNGEHNSGNMKDRTNWNKVVSNLNNISSSTENVVYNNDKNGDAQNDLKAGFKNMARVMARVIGYNMPQIKTEADLNKQLEIIFELINNECKCEYKSAYEDDKSDFLGNLNVKVSKGDETIHEFEIIQNDGHAYVTFPNLKSKDTVQQKLDDLLNNSKNSQELQELKDLFGCLLRISGKSDKYLAAINFFYLLFPYNCNNAILNKVPLEQLKKMKDGTAKDTAKTILRNLLLQRSELVIPVEVTLDGALLECKPSEFSELKQLTINGTIEGDLIPPPSLEKVTISYDMGNLNLSDCSNLTEVKLYGTSVKFILPKGQNKLEKLSVDNLKNCMNFSECTNLTDLAISGTIDGDLTFPHSLKKMTIRPRGNIMRDLNLSTNCPSLTDVEIYGVIGRSLILPSSLKKVTIWKDGKIRENLNLSKCTNLTEAKLYGTINENLILPEKADNLKELYVNYAKGVQNLSKCTNLTDLTIKNIYINEGLTLPPSLKKVTIWKDREINGDLDLINGNLDLSKCTNLTEAKLDGTSAKFILPKGQNKLEKLSINEYVSKNYMNLSECTNLTDLTIDGQIDENLDLPPSLKNVTIQPYGYITEDLNLSDCPILTDVKIDGFIGGSLILPSSLKKVIIDDYDYGDYGDYDDYSDYYKIGGDLNLSKCINLTEVSIRGDINGNLLLPEKINNLRKLSIIKNIEKGVQNLSKCTKLTYLTIDGKIGKGLTLPSSLKSVTIQQDGKINGNLDLSACTNLTNAEIYGTINENLILPKKADNLTILHIKGDLDLSKYTNLTEAYINGIIDGEKLILPKVHNKLKTLEVNNVINGLNLTECTNLTNLTINGEIDGSLVLPPSLNKVIVWPNGKINKNLDLSKCTNLTEAELYGTIVGNLTLPNKLKELSVKNVKGGIDFTECTNLTNLEINGEICGKLTIPSSLEKVTTKNYSKINGDLNLSKCTNLTKAYINGTIGGKLILPEANNLTILHINNIKGDLNLSKYTNLEELVLNGIDVEKLTLLPKSNKLEKLIINGKSSSI